MRTQAGVASASGPSSRERNIPVKRPLRAAPLIRDSDSKAERVAEILKAVAHPLRLRIIALLCEEDANVSALAERLGVSQSIVSQQLRILRMRQLVAVARERGFARYRILEPRLRQLVDCVEHCHVT